MSHSTVVPSSEGKALGVSEDTGQQQQLTCGMVFILPWRLNPGCALKAHLDLLPGELGAGLADLLLRTGLSKPETEAGSEAAVPDVWDSRWKLHA